MLGRGKNILQVCPVSALTVKGKLFKIFGAGVPISVGGLCRERRAELASCEGKEGRRGATVLPRYPHALVEGARQSPFITAFTLRVPAMK